MRVLVVDDDDGFREELTDLLARGGHLVRGVPTAGGAITALTRFRS